MTFAEFFKLLREDPEVDRCQWFHCPSHSCICHCSYFLPESSPILWDFFFLLRVSLLCSFVVGAAWYCSGCWLLRWYTLLGPGSSLCVQQLLFFLWNSLTFAPIINRTAADLLYELQFKPDSRFVGWESKYMGLLNFQDAVITKFGMQQCCFVLWIASSTFMFGQNKEVLNRNELETASYWPTVNYFKIKKKKSNGIMLWFNH